MCRNRCYPVQKYVSGIETIFWSGLENLKVSCTGELLVNFSTWFNVGISRKGHWWQRYLLIDWCDNKVYRWCTLKCTYMYLTFRAAARNVAVFAIDLPRIIRRMTLLYCSYYTVYTILYLLYWYYYTVADNVELVCANITSSTRG